jgi:CRP-like cAMP-binding protein
MGDEPFEHKEFLAGEVIFTEGEPGDAAYLVEGGIIEIVKNAAGDRSFVLAKIHRGGIFGEMALVDGRARMATARAAVDSTVIVVPREAFAKRLDRLDPVMRRLFNILVERVRSLADDLAGRASLFH